MAKVVSDEILKLKIVVNGDEGQKRILDIEMANKKLSNSIDEQRAKLQKLNYNKTKNREEIEKTRATIKKLTAEYDENLRRIDQEIRSMDIMSLTTQQLKRRMDELSFTMRHMNPNDPNYRLLQQELATLDSRYRQLRSGMGATAFSLKELSDKINQYSAFVTMAVIVITSMVVAINKAIDINNKLADAQSAVSKTTGLHIEQVRELTEAFKEFDTRTSQLDLLKIAEIGGRLGVAKEEIKDFTKEVDKVYVALGDGFSGGVEQVAESLGKLKGLYKETKDIPIAEAMNQIGSAINELGAAGAASEENIAEFAKRIGSLPDSMRPSIADALALGAAFEESGVDAERSGTAYSTFVKIAARSTDKFATVMKMTKKEVDDLINTNPMEFFLKFAEMAKGMDATELAKILDYLKLNDQYVSSIVSAASDNMDRFRKTINLSNKSLIEATSLQEEFNKVNNNSAAIYDKIKKKFEQIFTSDAVANTLNWLISSFGKLIGAIEDTDGKITTFRNTIVFLTKILVIGLVAVVSYNTAVLLSTKIFTEATRRVIALTIAQKWQNITTQVSTFLMNLWNIVIGSGTLAIAALTRSTTLQTAAQQRLNLVTKMNPFGALVAIIMAVVVAFKFLSDSVEKAREAQRRQFEESQKYQTQQKEIYKQGQLAAEDYKNSIQNLINVLKDENASQNIRKKAYEALIKLHPEFIGTVDKEYKATKDLARVYEELARQVDLSARMKARAAAKQSIYDENAKLELDYIKGATKREKEQSERNELRKRYSYDKNRGNSAVDMFGSFSEHNKGVSILNKIIENNKLLKKYNEEEKKRIKELQEAVKTAKGAKKREAEIELYGLLGISETEIKNTNGLENPGEEGKGGKKPKSAAASKAASEADKYKKDLEEILKLSEKYGEKNLDLQAEIEKRKIEMMEDGFEKEKAFLLLEFEENNRNREKDKISKESFAKLDEIIKKTKNEKTRAILEEEKFIWQEHNNKITTLQTQEEEITNLKLLKLQEKYLLERYKKEEDEFERRMKLLDREKNEKLSLESVSEQKDWLKSQGYTDENLKKIETWEQGRAAIEKEFQKKRLTEQLEFLQKQVAEFNKMASLSTVMFNPIALNPEQIKVIEEYKNKIAELTAEIAKLKNGEDTSEGTKKRDKGDLSNLGGKTDILGLSPDQWETLFTNTNKLEENMQKVTAALVIAKNMFASYAEFVTANENKMLQAAEYAHERKTEKLEKQLKAGLINQENYKKETIKNDKELDRKKAEIEYQQAKRQRAIQIADTIASTAAAVVGALGNKPWTPLNFALAGIVGAMGALQLATIMSQPLPTAPGAEEGLYPVIREQDGKLFSARKKRSRSGIYNEPTLLVGEGGSTMPELVVSGKDLKRVDPEITKMFMRDIDRVRGYENGMYPNVPTPTTTNSNSEIMMEMLTSLKQNNELMSQLRKFGIKAYIEKSAQNGMNIDEMIEDFKNIKNRNKHG